jgi:hypothetical protein
VKKLILLVFLINILGAAAAQEDGSKPPFSERIYFGGGGSLGGGNDFYGYRYFAIYVSPLVGYKITPNWSAGVALNYTYLSYPDQNVRLHQYGVSPFTRYNFGKLFAYAEYSTISVPSFDNSFRRTFHRFPIGLGYTMPIGQKAAINAMGLYDVLYDRRDGVFTSPWVIRVFITAGM